MAAADSATANRKTLKAGIRYCSRVAQTVTKKPANSCGQAKADSDSLGKAAKSCLRSEDKKWTY